MADVQQVLNGLPVEARDAIGTYFHSLIKKAEHAEFMLWPDNPAAWGGPFAEQYCIARIDLGSVRYLNPQAETDQQLHLDVVTRRECWPARILPPKRDETDNRVPKELVAHLKSLLTDDEKSEFDKIYTELHERIEWHGEYLTICTIEKPYRLILEGNDDTCYSRAYATYDEAEAALEQVRQSPSFDRLYQLKIMPY